MDYLRKRGMTTKTIREHRRFLFGSLSHSIQEKPLHKLKIADIADIIETGRMHGEYGSQRSVVVFRQYLKFLKNSGVKLPFDYRDIEVPKVPQKEPLVFEKEELLKVFECFPLRGKSRDRRLMAWSIRALCETMFGTGMRISEALSLTLRDWQRIEVSKEAVIKSSKTGGERTVFFTDRSIEWIKKYLEARHQERWWLRYRPKHDTLFVNGRGDPLKIVTVKSYFLRNRDKWGIGKKLRTHTFRRTMVNTLLNNGADIKAVQVSAGHKSERTTLRYYAYCSARRAKEVHRSKLVI